MKILDKMIEKGRVPSSLLFSGCNEAEMERVALSFAKKLLQTDRTEHPDLFVYQPEGKSGRHSIESMRNLTEEVFLAPYKSKRKLFIVKGAHRMMPTSSNALLKTFEEPAKNSTIILITSRKEALLPTILSRCQTITFSSITSSSQNSDHQIILDLLENNRYRTYHLVKEAVAFFSSKMEQKKKAWEEELSGELKLAQGVVTSKYLEEVRELLVNILTHLRSMSEIPIEKAIDVIDEARLQIDRHSPLAYVLQTLFLKLVPENT